MVSCASVPARGVEEVPLERGSLRRRGFIQPVLRVAAAIPVVSSAKASDPAIPNVPIDVRGDDIGPEAAP